MSLHTDFHAYLTGNATIVAVCPGGVFNELYLQSETVFPVLVYQQISGNEIAHDMEYPVGSKLRQARYQVDVWGELLADVIPAAEIVESELSAFSGAMGSTTVQRIETMSVSDQGERFGDKRRRRKSMDFLIFYS